MNDTQIVQAMLRREEVGIDNLYKNYNGALYGIIRRMVNNDDIAAELLQETMLKAWNKINTFDQEKGRLFTWLNTIARNTTIDKLRLKKFQSKTNSDSVDTQINLASDTQLPNDGIDAQNLLASLDSKYEVVLRKAYIEGYSQSEIAKELDIPLGTVKTRVRSGISELRTLLKDEKTLFFGIFLSLILILLIWS